MGRGVDLAALNSPENAAMIADLKEQLLIAFLKRLGGKVDMPVAEVDATNTHDLAFSLDLERKVFHFELRETPRG